jgi:hypothetical protein
MSFTIAQKKKMFYNSHIIKSFFATLIFEGLLL